MNEIYEAAWRTTLILAVLLVVARVLGRRTLVQLTFFDFVVGTTIGNIAATVVADKSANIYAVVASLATVTLWVLVISVASMKSLPARKLLEAQPLVVVYKGQVLEDNLHKRYYNVNDLLELLREQGVFSPSEVEVALIETDGALSVLKKLPYQEATTNSLAQPQGASLSGSNMVGKELIINGKIIDDNLEAAGMSGAELREQVASQGVRVEDVILGLLTPEGELYIDKQQDVTSGTFGGKQKTEK